MKIKLLLTLPILALSLAACKKSYTCACTVVTTIHNSNGSASISTQTKEVAYSEKMTQDQAKSACSHEKGTVESIETNIITFNGTQPGNGSASASCNVH